MKISFNHNRILENNLCSWVTAFTIGAKPSSGEIEIKKRAGYCAKLSMWKACYFWKFTKFPLHTLITCHRIYALLCITEPITCNIALLRKVLSGATRYVWCSSEIVFVFYTYQWNTFACFELCSCTKNVYEYQFIQHIGQFNTTWQN